MRIRDENEEGLIVVDDQPNHNDESNSKNNNTKTTDGDNDNTGSEENNEKPARVFPSYPKHRRSIVSSVHSLVVILILMIISCMWILTTSTPRRIHSSNFFRTVATTFFTTTAIMSNASSSSSPVAGAAFSSSSSSPHPPPAKVWTSDDIRNAATACSHHKIGLGTFMMNDSKRIQQAIRTAVQAGYRRIDCAPVYFNEHWVGDALHTIIRDEQLVSSRDDLFIVSKLPSPFHRKEHVELAVRKTLNDLRLDYLDLYLIHWPVSFEYVDIDPTKRGYDNEDIDDSQDGLKIDPNVSIHETWDAMQRLVDLGLVKYIGVSNFPIMLLHELFAGQPRIPPVVNQCESHPYLQQNKLIKYCSARHVHFQAYSPLGSSGFKEDNEPNLLQDPVLQEIASKYNNVTVAQVCLAWAIQRGTSVVVKSINPQRIRENIQVVAQAQSPETSFQLSQEDMEQIAQLHTRGYKYRYFRPEDWWPKFPLAVFD